VAAALALSATPAVAGECPNEQLRGESNTNSVTHKPFSTEAPDCRAYEMVSPLYKQGNNARPVALGQGPTTFPVAPDGNAVAFQSVGAFSLPENYVIYQAPLNDYISQRGPSGWSTANVLVPAKLMYNPFQEGLAGDLTPDLRSGQVSCGLTEGYAGVTCAMRKAGETWRLASPIYPPCCGATEEGHVNGYLGASADLSRVFIDPAERLRASDVAKTPYGSFYEIAGAGSQSPQLRLVNVDNNRQPLETEPGLGLGPLLGDSAVFANGTAYNAISQSGMTVFFSANPPGGSPSPTGVRTVYARVHCPPESSPSCHEDGNNEWLETVAVSSPSPPCTECAEPAAKPATFQGASADGSKVFFTTEQQLLPSDSNTTWDLYEYDFNKREKLENPLTLVSEGTPEARKAGLTEAGVEGVVKTSSDGRHVYFLASGVLTTESNENGEFAQSVPAAENLYGYDTKTHETKFVATVRGGTAEGEKPAPTAIAGGDEESADTQRHAQTTPDGRYLAFSTPGPEKTGGAGPLERTGDTNGIAQAVFRYDFQTGELLWVSRPAPEFTPTNEHKDATVIPVIGQANGSLTAGSGGGSSADSEDWNRAISENGDTMIFITAEKLQADDETTAPKIYEAHVGAPGTVATGRVSLGDRPFGPPGTLPAAAMSASGGDIFFFSSMQLVGQDTDGLVDLYDARKEGGFPAPSAEPSCPPQSAGGCQGRENPPPSFGAAASSLFTGGRNLAPPAITPPPPSNSKPKAKPLTRAQKLAKALKACKRKPKKTRHRCEKQARRKYRR
jgi:hypothetical protein